MFFKILKLAADGFLTCFFDFQFWSVAPPQCANLTFHSLKLIIDQPTTEVYFAIFLIEATSEAPGW